MKPEFTREDEQAGGQEHFEDAALYDFEYRRRRADVRFYRTLAAERGGPILDLACGTGRLLIPLVRDGHLVVGLDRSASMLERAAARVARLPALRRRQVLLVRSDLRAFAFGRPFMFAVCGFHSVQHLIEDRDVTAFLTQVRQSLAPGGWLAFDLLTPDPRWMGRDPRRRWSRTVFRHPVTGERLVYTTNHHYDAPRRVLHMRIYYQPVDGQGRAAGPERIVRLCHRQFSPSDVIELLARAKLELIASYGGFDSRPLDGDCEEAIYVARRSPSENARGRP